MRKQRGRWLIACVLLLGLTLAPVYNVVAESGPSSIVALFDVWGDDTQEWMDCALYDAPPAMLTVSAVGETLYWKAEIHNKERILSYLYALDAIEVDISRSVWMAEDALTLTYSFHTPGGSDQTFVFQDGCAVVGPDGKMFPVAGTGGLEKYHADLASLDRVTQQQQQAIDQSNAIEQRRQTVRVQDGYLVLIMEESTTTGFLWSYAVGPEGALVCVRDEHKADESARVTTGGGGRRFLTFQAAGAGEALLLLTRRGPDGSVDHKMAFQVYADEKGITAVERVHPVP